MTNSTTECEECKKLEHKLKHIGSSFDDYYIESLEEQIKIMREALEKIKHLDLGDVGDCFGIVQEALKRIDND